MGATSERKARSGNVVAGPLGRAVAWIEGAKGLDRLATVLGDLVGTLTRPAAVRDALSGSWLGHQLHPVLTDVPIGAWLSASLVDAFGGPAQAGVARRLTGVGVLAAAPTAAAGWTDWSTTIGPARRLGLVHGLANATVIGLHAASYLARRAGRHHTGAALGAAGMGALAVGAYLGGHLSLVRGIGVAHTAFEQRTTAWTDVAALDELGEGVPVRRDADGTPVVLVRRDDQVHALSATCVHAGGPLDEGELVDGCLRCPWHGSTFALADGAVVHGPAAAAQPAWAARVTDGRVYVRDAAATD